MHVEVDQDELAAGFDFPGLSSATFQDRNLCYT